MEGNRHRVQRRVGIASDLIGIVGEKHSRAGRTAPTAQMRRRSMRPCLMPWCF